MKRIAVLISNKGTGTNLAAILNAIENNKIKNGKVVVVVSDKEDAYGLVRARRKNIPTIVLSLKEFLKQGKGRNQYDEHLALLLKKKYRIDLVVLAGWMLILSQHFLKYFPNQILNLHPGLLPDGSSDFIKLSSGKKIRAIRGLHTNDAVQFALDQGYPTTGSTVHFITEKVDEGPVVIRSEVHINPDDSVESLYKRIKIEEHKILPIAIGFFCDNKLRISKGRVIIRDIETSSA